MSPSPAAGSTIEPLPVIKKTGGSGGASSSLLRTRQTKLADGAVSRGKNRAAGGDGSFADGASGPPQAGAFSPRKVPPTKFRFFYNRADIPISVLHRPNGNQLDWKMKPEDLDYYHYLPVFFDGLRETEEPYHFLALQGCYDLLAHGGEKKVLPCVPQLITPIKTALHTRIPDVIRTVLLVLQRLVVIPFVGEALVPYFRQILLIIAMFKGRTRNLRDGIDYGQRKRADLGELIEETVQMMEMYGGRDALTNIKYVMPTYESCQVAVQQPQA